jgi:hypothetical protein
MPSDAKPWRRCNAANVSAPDTDLYKALADGAREWRGMHGNDKRISLETLHGGVRACTKMLVAVAAP